METMDSRIEKNESLRRHRLQRNWRLSDVAEQLGTTVTTVQRWEQGTQQPRLYYRRKLCDLFGLTAQELHLEEQEERASSSLPMQETCVETPPGDVLTISPLWTVPYARNPHFTGRADLLARLEHLLTPYQAHASHQVAFPPPLALTGLGGIGKTQIALEYAYRFYEQHPTAHVLWVTAANEETTLTSFVTVANLLSGLVGVQQTDQQQLVRAVRRWLEQCQDPWLLVMDNADDLKLVQPYLPRYGNGRVLLTTRARAVGLLAVPLEVENLLQEEGTRFLLRRTHRLHGASTEDVTQARQIVDALARFPLALDQAGAYIEETDCDFATYLDLYQHHRHHLLARRGVLSSHYPYSVTTTWSLSFQHLKQRNPAAIHLLRLCAFLAPDHIPEELFTQGATHWPPQLQQAVADPFAFNQMLQDLLAFSLVKRLAAKKQVSLHRLVQVVQREQLDPQEQHQWAVRVVHALHTLFPDAPWDPATWPRCHRYLEQAQACGALIHQYNIHLPEAAELLDRVGTYLQEMGFYRSGEPLYAQALSIREQVLGAQHLVTTESLNNLAIIYFRQGKYRQAQPLLERVLHIREHQLGDQHLATAQSFHNLAIVYCRQGKYVQAQRLLQQALALAREQLGPNDEKTANCLENLANVYQEQGKYSRAERCYRRALTIAEEQVTAEHSFFSYALTGLASLLLLQNKDDEAERLIQRVLTRNERQWGTDHPQMAEPLYQLATLYSHQGKCELAEPLFQKALAIWEQQEHPDMARALTGLATLYSQQGKYGRAELLFQQALTINTQQLGREHPETAHVLAEWGDSQRRQGHRQEALALYQQALAIREASLGPDHRHTRALQERIATFQQSLKREQAPMLPKNYLSG
jgi:tetratricopeptide (TPR) repeat protein/transcriptional regulator with XRE-family HTH domain